MKKYYGSLTNRLEENQNLVKELKVGTLATEYLYSDRHAYEVTKVVSQENVFIRQLDTNRIDNNGMSDSQIYEFKSNPNNVEKELKLTKYGWKEVIHYNLERYKKVLAACGYCLWDNAIVEKVKNGKEVKRYRKINITFGIADEHYDYSF